MYIIYYAGINGRSYSLHLLIIYYYYYLLSIYTGVCITITISIQSLTSLQFAPWWLHHHHGWISLAVCTESPSLPIQINIFCVTGEPIFVV